MKKYLLWALLFGVVRLHAGTVTGAAPGPLTTLTIDLTPLGLTNATIHTVQSQCWTGTGFATGDVTGSLSPVTNLLVDSLIPTSITLHIANSVSAAMNVVCAVSTGASGTPSITQVQSDPSGSCTAGVPLQFNTTNGHFTGCNNGTWSQISGGGLPNVSGLIAATSGSGRIGVTADVIASLGATASQAAHQVLGTCGAATTIAPCALVAGDIPALPYDASGAATTAQSNATAAGATSAASLYVAKSATPITAGANITLGGTTWPNITISSTSGAGTTAFSGLTGTIANTQIPSGVSLASPSLAATPLTVTRVVGTGGVTANYLVTINSAGQAVTPAPGACGGGVAMSTQSVGNNVEVAILGTAQVYADNATTAGDIAVCGSTTAGYARDSTVTASSAIALGTATVGKILNSVAAGQLATIQLHVPGSSGTQLTSAPLLTGLGFNPLQTGGDIAGTSTAPTVAGLRGYALPSTAPADKQANVFNASCNSGAGCFQWATPIVPDVNGSFTVGGTGTMAAINLTGTSNIFATQAPDGGANPCTAASQTTLHLTINGLDSCDTGTGNQAMMVPRNPAGYMLLQGGLFGNVAAQSATAFTVTAGGQRTLLANATSGAQTITLTASPAGTGINILKVDNSANSITVTAQSGGNINGATTFVMSYLYQGITLISDGANWWTPGGNPLAGATGTGAPVLATSPTITTPALVNSTIGGTEQSYSLPNDGTGTALNKLVKLSNATAGSATIATTADVSGVLGIAVGGAAIGTGNVQIAFAGQASCVFGDPSATTTANDYVVVSTQVNGGCTDTGSVYPTTGVQVVGRVLSTNAAGGTYPVLLANLGKSPNYSAIAPPATTTTTGVVELAGDLAGTATAPTVAKVNGLAPPASAARVSTNASGQFGAALDTEKFCGTNATCSLTNIAANFKMIAGQATLVSGSPSAVTVTGFSPAFTSTGSFVCTASDNTSVSALKVVINSTTSININGPASVSDVVSYICFGN